MAKTQKTGLAISLAALVASAATAPLHASAAPTKPVLQTQTAEASPFLEAERADAYSAALQFVESAGLVKNLSLLLLEEVKQSAEVNAAIDRDGMDDVQNKVVRAIRTAQKVHGGEWAEVLAKAYSQHFTAVEMQSILQERENSAHFIRLLQLQEQLADTIRIEGDAIFNQARSEVLGTVALRLSR